MSGPGATPLFVDTGALYARFDTDDQHHDDAVYVFENIVAGDFVYRPLYVSTFVLSELATLVLHNSGPEQVPAVLNSVYDSSLFTVVHPDESTLEAARKATDRYADQEITLVDHLTGVLAENRSVERIFGFDSDFRTLGFALVPADTGDLVES